MKYTLRLVINAKGSIKDGQYLEELSTIRLSQNGLSYFIELNNIISASYNSCIFKSKNYIVVRK
jgi:hypothetical protein